jgi:Icc-related predicted phosphoesterase
MRMPLRRKQRGSTTSAGTVDLYYASDVHGSEQCWRKFLGAGRFYSVQALIMGGDLTGKAIVPITISGDAFAAHFLDEDWSGNGPEELNKLEQAIRYNGMYPWPASAEEVRLAEADAEVRHRLFEQVMIEELQRWIGLADERMAAYGIGVYVMPGNDDPWICDQIIEGAAHVQACDERVVRVGDHEMISCAYANPTPWNSPRELDEESLYTKLKALADQLESPQTAIFNLHVPPYDTGLDTANEINPDLTLVYRSGQPNPIPVGSTAVRQIIEEYQPLLGLHGHIHESRGDTHIGRTLCINSGSEYNSGRIHGVTVSLTSDAVVSRQFVIG